MRSGTDTIPKAAHGRPGLRGFCLRLGSALALLVIALQMSVMAQNQTGDTTAVPPQPSPDEAKIGALADKLDKAAERAMRNAQKSAGEAARARDEAEALRTANDALRTQAEQRAKAAQKEADRLARTAADAKARAEQAKRSAERMAAERAAAERHARIAVGIGIALVLLVGSCAFLWVRRIRGRQVEPSSSCVLRSPKANISLAGTALPLAAGGVVVGRNPAEAQAVVNHNEVSRRHARIFWEGGSFWIEDIGSLHGTEVDGDSVAQGERHKLMQGSRIVLAEAVEFEFDVLP